QHAGFQRLQRGVSLCAAAATGLTAAKPSGIQHRTRPRRATAMTPDLAFNTAVSFTTNTNWQSYGGEATLSYLVQMLGLTMHNFTSAAVGMAIAVAMIRGFM